MPDAAHSLSLTAIAITAGVALLWAFGRFSDQPRIRAAKRKLRAHLYAFRLFADEPALVLRAQKQLLVWNARYLALMLRPAAVVLVPMLALLLQMEPVYGVRPLRVGEQALVTAQMDATAACSLEGRGVAVETPPVRLPDQHRVVWRIRVTDNGEHSVVLRAGSEAVVKRVQSGAGLRYISERRVASPLEWLRYPAEPRLAGGHVRWIEVSYPAPGGMNWLIVFFAVNLLTMLALRKRFGVTF